MKKKYKSCITFDTEYHRDLFEDWMSNLGEQLFDQQLDVEKENVTDVPCNLLTKSLIFRYPVRGEILVKAVEDEE